MVANLFGDFVKGKDYSYLPEIVQEGVLLHRQIDDYIDHHPAVTELRLDLYKELPKIAGIAIDLYFDHLLATNWSNFHENSLDQFVDTFNSHALNQNNLHFYNPKYIYPSSFIRLLKMINEHNILKRNTHLEGLSMASKGLSRSISFKNNLNTATDVFLNNEKQIESVFRIYMKDAGQKFNNS
jgi:acyl carrier protein phosphodiesterase